MIRKIRLSYYTRRTIQPAACILCRALWPAVGKHVMLVELLCAALQQQSGFFSPEEVLDKLKSLQLPQIEGCVTGPDPLTHSRHLSALPGLTPNWGCMIKPVITMIRNWN